MVGGYVGMLGVLMLFWVRLVNKIGIVICPGLTKYSKLKVIPEGSLAVVASYNILKLSCKEGAMITFHPKWILVTHCFRLGSPIVVFTATSLPIPN